MLTPYIIKKIQSCDIGELGPIYKKIVEDTNWIKKYAPLEDRNKAYIDFCFDYIIDKLDIIIAEQQYGLEYNKKYLTELEDSKRRRQIVSLVFDMFVKIFIKLNVYCEYHGLLDWSYWQWQCQWA